MPFINLSPAYNPYTQSSSDPLLEFLSAALAPEQQAPKPQQPTASTQPQQKIPAQCRGPCAPRFQRVYKRIINPSFDVSELPASYILEGELPGVTDKSSIQISFDDAQTIVIKGEVKRHSRDTREDAFTASSEEKKEEVQQPIAEIQLQQEESASTTSKSHSVTVEEVSDESDTASNDDFEVVDGPTKADKGKAPVTTTDVEMTEAPKQSAAPKKEESKPRYWISERSIGVFERRFNFQGLIDQDNVKASLENGLLTVVVPKRKAYVRQVNIE